MKHRPSSPLTMTASDWLLMLVQSGLWGGAFYFIKIAGTEIPPLTLVFCRVAIAGAVLGAIMRPLGASFPGDARTWRDYFLLAALNNSLPFTLLVWGQMHVTVGLASILIATSPLFTAMLAHLVTHDDKLSAGRAIGLTVGLAGVVILIGPELLTDLGTQVWAQFALLGASLLYSSAALVVRRRFATQPPIAIAGSQLVASAVLMLPFMLAIDRPWTLPPLSNAALAAMVSLAVFSTAFAYLIYFRIISRAGATNATLVTLLVPVSAILLGMMLLDESLEPRQAAGMAAVALGLVAIDGRPGRWLARHLPRIFQRTNS